jgi:hypothetical protein
VPDGLRRHLAGWPLSQTKRAQTPRLIASCSDTTAAERHLLKIITISNNGAQSRFSTKNLENDSWPHIILLTHHSAEIQAAE